MESTRDKENNTNDPIDVSPFTILNIPSSITRDIAEKTKIFFKTKNGSRLGLKGITCGFFQCEKREITNHCKRK